MDRVTQYIENFSENNDEFSDSMCQAATSCKEKLENYYDVTSDGCTVATVLDPRLKLEYYKAFENQEGHTNSLEIKQKAKYAATHDSAAAPATKATGFVQSIFKKRKITPQSELDEYLNQPTVDATIQPLNWWKSNELMFPTLSKMAKDYLAIPGTSASSERLFSSGRQLITDFRCSLSPATIQACMCLKGWLKAEKHEEKN
ncbi:HAT dimerization domain-containing protein [Rozella allomycis CSF55]|uniref:HAT dimerization domain-containing protein n=1 Tax=Rozella allomycis (strain CSF55) TaxID=988480 RepID=A0A075B0L2_ROZAC|nr:HAT dimerization domain-containing protein [Rozella allomycis CSF55]|eukprot:EPZ36066.1 HAT dimerization domain-containing protein [Rozella allomycis CSF55]